MYLLKIDMLSVECRRKRLVQHVQTKTKWNMFYNYIALV